MKLNIAVFFGGVSCEHEISIISANQVINALNKDKYNVIPVYISKDGDMYHGELLNDLKQFKDLNNLLKKLSKVTIYKDGNQVLINKIKSVFFKPISVDVAFPILHGTNGEDGAIQGLFELLRLPYTSSNVLGSSVGQDKDVMKQILKHHNIPLVSWFAIFQTDYDEKKQLYLEKAKEIAFPLIAKPSNLGSSIGIEIIHNEQEFDEKIQECLKYDFKVVVEKMITNLKEVNISVLNNNGEVITSVIEEVMKNDELLSFNDKYVGGGKSSKVKQPSKSKGMASTSRIVPANIDSNQTKIIEQYAKESYIQLNAFGTVRIDFMIDKDNGEVYVNEINSIPGSLAYYLWKDKGISFDVQLDIMINSALKRQMLKEKKTYTFESNVLK